MTNANNHDLLRKAVQSGSPDAIAHAVGQGADVNARDEAGETPLTLATEAGLGAEKSHACVQRLLELGARVSEEKPNGGLGTSVHQAALHGYTEALKALLSADGATAFNVFDDVSRTPLICAIHSGNVEAARLLLEAGAYVDAHDVDRAGNTALIVAVQNQNLPMIQLLLRHGANPTITGWMQMSALDRARDWARAETPAQLHEIFKLLADAASRQRTKSP